MLRYVKILTSFSLYLVPFHSPWGWGCAQVKVRGQRKKTVLKEPECLNVWTSNVWCFFYVYTLKPVDYLCSQVLFSKILKSVIRFEMFIFIIFKDSLGQMVVWALVQKKKIRFEFFFGRVLTQDQRILKWLFSAVICHAFWAISSDYTHSLWLFLSLFKLSLLSLSVFLTGCLFLRMNHSAPPLWFPLSFTLCELSVFDKFWSFLKIPDLVLQYYLFL